MNWLRGMGDDADAAGADLAWAKAALAGTSARIKAIGANSLLDTNFSSPIESKASRIIPDFKDRLNPQGVPAPER